MLYSPLPQRRRRTPGSEFRAFISRACFEYRPARQRPLQEVAVALSRTPAQRRRAWPACSAMRHRRGASRRPLRTADSIAASRAVTARFSAVSDRGHREIHATLCFQLWPMTSASSRASSQVAGNKLGSWLGCSPFHHTYDFRRSVRLSRDARVSRGRVAHQRDPASERVVVLRERARLVSRLLEGFTARIASSSRYYADASSPSRIANAGRSAQDRLLQEAQDSQPIEAS